MRDLWLQNIDPLPWVPPVPSGSPRGTNPQTCLACGTTAISQFCRRLRPPASPGSVPSHSWVNSDYVSDMELNSQSGFHPMGRVLILLDRGGVEGPGCVMVTVAATGSGWLAGGHGVSRCVTVTVFPGSRGGS